MTTSNSINELATALAKAQKLIGGAKKDSANPFFKSKYADLASVRDACRDALADHGLAVLQSPTAVGATVSVETMLAHSSGQWVRDTLTVTAKDDSPQSVGSAITYLRRYAMQSFAGIAPEDDDAEAAQGRSTVKAASTVQVITEPKGYRPWLDALADVVPEGIDKFRQAFKDSKQEYRDHLTKTDQPRLDKLVKDAKAVKVLTTELVSA